MITCLKLFHIASPLFFAFIYTYFILLLVIHAYNPEPHNLAINCPAHHIFHPFRHVRTISLLAIPSSTRVRGLSFRAEYAGVGGQIVGGQNWRV